MMQRQPEAATVALPAGIKDAKLKIALVAICLLITLLSLLALLQMQRFKQMLIQVESSLVSVPALALKNDIERSLALGLPLNANRQLDTMLRRMRARYPEIVSLHLLDADTEPGSPIWQDGPPLISPQHIVLSQRRNPGSIWFDAHDPNGYILSWRVNDTLGHLVACLTVRFDRSKSVALLENARRYMTRTGAALILFSLLILVPILFYVLAGLERMLVLAQVIMGAQAEVDDSGARPAQSP
jgi:hypothetical protein